MRKTAYFVTAVLFLSISTIFAPQILAIDAEVAQGKCISFDREKGEVTIEEYDTNFSQEHPYGMPTGRHLHLRLTKNTLIGIPPEPGDILRIAYIEQDGSNVALRIMNVSKQDLRKK
ncbi:hypothetical protein [Thermodesulforhabdus norvegica]|uniref:DUF5666 domain-containing protein n=1 Tax=Thermodesulforhabdus norvegica TaxID=39841 RepID=A0A1I4U5N7_9BACT|nr:hypothetical protein [Thermodesulforhabdus norvegica]SFM84235.1 hypothetical protein SAMN05660836_01650 [Thermodesulforhabdus norvegica]